MFIPKKYGQGKVDSCPFCGKDAFTKNSQEIPVCQEHKASILKGLTCLCGDDLELKDGKFGTYFNCINCGNKSLKKALDMNPGFENNSKTNEKTIEKNEIKSSENKDKKEITITSDEVDINYS
jgi:hypothetical protein|tara:strand:+ start:117 stop:485 length:369 start_codon:yes stop_codon:yes gene_type:complete